MHNPSGHENHSGSFYKLSVPGSLLKTWDVGRLCSGVFISSLGLGAAGAGLAIISTQFMLAVILIPHSFLAPNLSAQELVNGCLLNKTEMSHFWGPHCPWAGVGGVRRFVTAASGPEE